jgi:hypothetical protein
MYQIIDKILIKNKIRILCKIKNHLVLIKLITS